MPQGGSVVVVVLVVVVLVVGALELVEVLVVVEVVPPQPAPQASQQLGHAPGVPPCRAQAAASRCTRQVGAAGPPRQQATFPGLPHVDLAAQRRTALRHVGGSPSRPTRSRITAPAQRRYAPRLAAPLQEQAASISARAAATASGSSHAAKPGEATAETAARARRPRASHMAGPPLID
jgi:hypothetical protein